MNFWLLNQPATDRMNYVAGIVADIRKGRESGKSHFFGHAGGWQTWLVGWLCQGWLVAQM